MNKLSDFNEKTLIDALKGGNQDAYRKLYLNYYNKLCKYIFYICNNNQQAEDIVQEVLLDFWEKRKNIVITTSLTAYLYKATHNKYIDVYRNEKRKLAYINQLQEDAIISIENTDETIKKERLLVLHKAIDKLPPKRKEIFILSKLQNLKYKEIAEKLNISERTVESQIRKAFIFLRQYLKESIIILKLLLLLEHSI